MFLTLFKRKQLHQFNSPYHNPPRSWSALDWVMPDYTCCHVRADRRHWCRYRCRHYLHCHRRRHSAGYIDAADVSAAILCRKRDYSPSHHRHHQAQPEQCQHRWAACPSPDAHHPHRDYCATVRCSVSSPFFRRSSCEIGVKRTGGFLPSALSCYATNLVLLCIYLCVCCLCDIYSSTCVS